MKKIQFKVLFLVLIFINAHVQSQPKNDLEWGSIKGHVKSVIVSTFSYNMYFSKLKKKNLILKKIFRYGPNGNLNELAFYNRKDRLYERNIFEYDSLGYRTRGKSLRRDTITYKYTYQYDGKGNRAMEFQFNTQDSLVKKTIFSYNSTGQPTRADFYDPAGSLIGIQRIVYDDNSLIIETSEYDSGNKLIRKYHYTYEDYDITGNWLRQTPHIINRGPVEITVREIEYY